MAFGFSPKYSTELPFGELIPEHALVLALETAKALGWNIGYTHKTGFVAYTSFSMSSYSEEIKIKLGEHALHLKSECTGNQLMDWGKNKRNISRFVNRFNGLKETMSVEEISLKYESLLSALEDNADEQPEEHANTKEKITSFFSVFKPSGDYFITPVLINLNIAVFLIMVLYGVHFMMPDGPSLVKWGANFRPSTLNGQAWRLLTCTFLHAGFLHLLVNMYALLYIGLLLEPRLGRTRFTGAYLITGIAASLASLWWKDFTISVGASGAVFGLYGVFLAMLTTNLIEKSARKALLTSIGIFVVYNLLNGMHPGIDNAAHMGGLVCGLLMGYAYYPSLREKGEKTMQYTAMIGLATALIFIVFLVFRNTSSGLREYEKRMEMFVYQEQQALSVFGMPADTEKNMLMYELKERGIYYWNENLNLLQELEKLELPDEFHKRHQKLQEYCRLRIKAYELIYKTLEEDTEVYKPQIEDYNKQISLLIDELKEKP